MAQTTFVPPHRLVEAAAIVGVSSNGIIFADEAYYLPSYRWVTDTFSPAWMEAVRLLGVKDWRVDTNDCDDFARFCAGYAQLLNNKTVADQAMPSAALAFGEFWYAPENGGGHAINVFFFGDAAGVIGLAFFEPQTGQVVMLTEHEKRSCTFLRL